MNKGKEKQQNINLYFTFPFAIGKITRYGGCGEVVNTSGCEPDTRQFDSDHPPHNSRIGLIQCYQAFFVV